MSAILTSGAVVPSLAAPLAPRGHADRGEAPQPITQPGRGDLPPIGVLVEDADGSAVQCHVCGGWYRLLGAHARKAHHLTAADYRARYGLARTLALAAPRLRLVRQESGRRKAAARG